MEYGKVIGIGNTAAVYEWEDGKVLKLFNQGYPKEAAENEFHNAMAIRDMDFPKPKAYEMVTCEGRIGIIYDRAEGESLLNWAMKTGDVQGCAAYMAKLHKAILRNRIGGVPDYRDFLRHQGANASSGSPKKMKEILQKIDKLPEGDILCHGDFHPGNILLSGGNTMVIDFMNVCHGSFLYDVARTVFLVEYTPVPTEADNRKTILEFKKALANIYLDYMNVNREMIQNYLQVIIETRKGECPDE